MYYGFKGYEQPIIKTSIKEYIVLKVPKKSSER